MREATKLPIGVEIPDGGNDVASRGNMGTPIVLERESGQPSQVWSLTKRENGTYALTPKHAPGMGVDLLGGKQNPGAKVDLWTLNVNDPHLQNAARPTLGKIIVDDAFDISRTKRVQVQDAVDRKLDRFAASRIDIFAVVHARPC